MKKMILINHSNYMKTTQNNHIVIIFKFITDTNRRSSNCAKIRKKQRQNKITIIKKTIPDTAQLTLTADVDNAISARFYARKSDLRIHLPRLTLGRAECPALETVQRRSKDTTASP